MLNEVAATTLMIKIACSKESDLKFEVVVQNIYFKMPVSSVINDDFCRALAGVAHNGKGDKG